MQIKTIYINESNFDSANFDLVESRQIMMIYIFALRIFEH